MNDDSLFVSESFSPLVAPSSNVSSIYTLITQIKTQSCLKINDGLQIHMSRPVPNRWHQFWQKLFFGFVWEKVNN